LVFVSMACQDNEFISHLASKKCNFHLADTQSVAFSSSQGVERRTTEKEGKERLFNETPNEEGKERLDPLNGNMRKI